MTFEDAEFKALKKAKDKTFLTWHDFILEVVGI
jgi:hypothetical protein